MSNALRKYVCEKLAAITSGIPFALKHVTACSRLDPVPKLKPTHHHVAGPRPRGELGIVILHHHPRLVSGVMSSR